MKKTITLLLITLLIINMSPLTNTSLAAESLNPILENINVDKKLATSGDTIKLSVKLANPAGVNYIDSWYIAPVSKNDIHIKLYYNMETDLFEGNIPIYSVSETGDYHLTRMVFYGSNNNIVDLHQSELFVNGDFQVTGTNGEGLLKSVSVDKREATSGDTVRISVKLTTSVGINYIDAWYISPVNKNYIHVDLSYNMEADLYEGSLPIYAVSESGEYNLSRMVFYGAGNTVDLHQSELFNDGDFLVSGTNSTGIFESLNVNMREATFGDVLEFNVKVREKDGINYILLWYTSPITNRTIHVKLYYNGETDLFEASLPIDSSYELGDYNINRYTIYSSGVIYDFIGNENKLETGKFSVFSEQNPPSFSSLSVSKKEVGSGESIKIYVEATDDTNLQSASVNYISPGQSIVSIPLQYDGAHFIGDYNISDITELGNWTVDSVEIKDTNENTTIVKASEIDLTEGNFFVKDITAPTTPTVNEVNDKSTIVTGNAEIGSTVIVSVNDSIIGSALTGADGEFSVIIPVQKSGTKLLVTATDKGGNVSVAKEVIVKDITSPATPTVNEVTDKSTSVTGTAESESEIEVSMNESVIGSGTTGLDGKFTVIIPVQKAGMEIVVTATDKAGNVSATAKVVVKDVTAPGQPIVNAVNDKNTSVTGQAEEGSKVEVKVSGSLIGSAIAGTDGKFTVTIPVQKAGTEIVVTATDEAGNVSPATKAVVKDVTAPGHPTVNAVTDKSTSVTGQAEAGSKVDLKVNGAAIGSATAGTDGKFTVTIPVQKAGTEIVVTATDKAGNVSTATKVVVKDVTAPGTPTVNAVNDKNTSVTGQAEAGSKVEVKVSGTLIGSATAGTDGKFTVTIPVQKAGTEIVVTATDKAGNVSAAAKVVVKDVTAPGQPTVNAVSDKSTSVTGQAEAGSKVEVKVNGTLIGSTTAGTDEKFNVSIPVKKAGTEIVVTATDKAGNVSIAAKVVVKDVTAPGKPAVNEVSDKDTSVMGQAEAGSKIEVKVNGALIGSDTTDSNGMFLVAIPVQKSGTKVVFTAVDKSGNVSEGLTVTVKDATSPEAPKVVELTDRETKLTGSAEPSSTIIAKVSGVEIGRGVADEDGKFAITIPKQASGKVVEVYAKDNAGNVSPVTKITVKKKLVSLVGENRYATAVKVAQTGWNTADTVLLVNGFAIVDGLTATPLASAKNSPILLTAADSIPKPTMDEITRLKAKEIILIGGEGVITPKVEKELVAKGFKVTRIGGLNRKDTSLLIAKELDKLVDVSTVYVAYGWGEPDALSIAAQAGLKKQPIILADKTSVPADTFAWLKTEALSDAYFIGGEGVVAPAILSEIDKITSGNVLANRLSGLNRHETNAKVISRFYPETELQTILVAKSETPSLVDALAAGPLAAKLGSPVLLVSSYIGLLPEQQKVLAGKNSKYVHQIGGGVNPKALGEVVE